MNMYCVSKEYAKFLTCTDSPKPCCIQDLKTREISNCFKF